MVEHGLIAEDERLEVIDGEIVEMSPKGYRHEGLKGAINRHWGRTCPSEFDYLPETGLYLSDDTYLEPDFVLFRAGLPLPDLKGPEVLLAIEVADSSLAYDLRRKPVIYALFGVKELWVIDVRSRRVHRHREPGRQGFGRIDTEEAETQLEPAFGPAEMGFRLLNMPEH